MNSSGFKSRWRTSCSKRQDADQVASGRRLSRKLGLANKSLHRTQAKTHDPVQTAGSVHYALQGFTG
jgi:hypothetical protein